MKYTQLFCCLLNGLTTSSAQAASDDPTRPLIQHETSPRSAEGEIHDRVSLDAEMRELARYGVGTTDPIGKGGFGCVYQLKNTAIKTPSINPSDKLIEQWNDYVQTEKDALAAISDPKDQHKYGYKNVLHLVLADLNKRYHYAIFTTFVAGQELFYRMTDPRKIFSFQFICRMEKQMSAALDFIHSLGIVHRDVKPENIIVNYDPNNPKNCKFTLIDFGLSGEAKTIEQKKKLCGTPDFIDYMVVLRNNNREKKAYMNYLSDLFALHVTMLQAANSCHNSLYDNPITREPEAKLVATSYAEQIQNGDRVIVNSRIKNRIDTILINKALDMSSHEENKLCSFFYNALTTKRFNIKDTDKGAAKRMHREFCDAVYSTGHRRADSP